MAFYRVWTDIEIRVEIASVPDVGVVYDIAKIGDVYEASSQREAKSMFVQCYRHDIESNEIWKYIKVENLTEAEYRAVIGDI